MGLETALTAAAIASIAGTGYNIYASERAAKRMPQYTPAAPASYYGPEGAQVWDPERNAYVWQESPKAKAAREQREKMREEVLAAIGVTSPAREAQLEGYKTAFKEEFLKKSQPTMEQALIGRGLGGSTVFKEALTDLISEAAIKSIFAGEDIRSREETEKLNILNALESGISAQTARAMQAAGIPISATQAKESGAQAGYQSLLNKYLTKYQGRQQALSDLTGNLSMLAFLSAMGGGKTTPKGTGAIQSGATTMPELYRPDLRSTFRNTYGYGGYR